MGVTDAETEQHAVVATFVERSAPVSNSLRIR